MLEIENLTFAYGRKTVLSKITLSMSTGTTVLLGRNGAGKTTMMRVVAGAARPSLGEVRVNGAPCGGNTRQGRRGLRAVGWLPQEFGFPPRMTTARFLAYAAWLKEVPRTEVPGRVEVVLAQAGLADKRSVPLGSLSGGQRRRAGLAAALVADPRVLILDEPTAGLDPEQRDAFHQLIMTLRQDKVVVVATHLLEDVDALADRIAVLDAGSLRWSGTPEELATAAGAEPSLGGLRRGFQVVLGNRS